MCGVIGIVVENEWSRLGAEGGKLLQMLEYRGYDSMGAVVQKATGETTLLKDVGAPSDLVSQLGLDRLSGKSFCGQVRWATFGAMTKANAQPHEMRCKTHVYGAHNGNITNCDQLKEWLTEEGHDVKSDNDGEMLVHVIEHEFAELVAGKTGFEERKEALAAAVVQAAKRVIGSYAAVVIDPVTQCMAAIKAGSSFYVGMGHNDDCGNYVIASSDLGTVLVHTKILLPIAEGEFIIATPDGAEMYATATGERLEREPVRSLLNTWDTQLHAPYSYFMEQEIHSQPHAASKLIRLYTGRSPVMDFFRDARNTSGDLLKAVQTQVMDLVRITDFDQLERGYAAVAGSAELAQLSALAQAAGVQLNRLYFTSTMSGLLDEIKKHDENPYPLLLVDALFELLDHEDLRGRIGTFVDELFAAHAGHRKVYFLACGTSYHAVKTAAIFFNEIAGVQIVPLLPGEFRASAGASIRDGDVMIGVSQSGETKDLIDIFDQVERSGKEIVRISIVNNVNSTLALEKVKTHIPLYCGPEIAVPATKSFTSQLLALYHLALEVATKTKPEPEHQAELDRYRANFFKIPSLLSETLDGLEERVDPIAVDLFEEPSIHILATRLYGVSLEGALKVREVVLNHTQGYESSEFKHGPNTILGLNTLFGLESVRTMLKEFSGAITKVLDEDEGKDIGSLGVHRLYKAAADFAFDSTPPQDLNAAERRLFNKIFAKHNFFDCLYKNYPLVFVTGPDERDVNLTISQVNTHKIRGANIYMIAEPNELLEHAVTSAPDVKHEYRHSFLALPETGDTLLPIFTSTVVLQVLALKMSIRKMNLLSNLEIDQHGVHPDSPKNVSKSITVD